MGAATDAGLTAPVLIHLGVVGDALLRVFEWVDGAVPSAAMSEREAAALGADLGQAVAALHRVEVEQFSRRLDATAERFDSWAAFIHHRLGQVRDRCAEHQAFDAAVTDRAAGAILRLADIVDPVARPVICHRDVHVDNLLVDGDGRLGALLDFDSAEAWDRAGEWFKLRHFFFANLPAARAPFEAAYDAVHGPRPMWPQRVALVDLIEELNLAANVIANNWDHALADASHNRLDQLLNNLPG